MTLSRIFAILGPMAQRLERRFGPWILFHALEFKWFYLGAFLCLFFLQLFQREIPERIRYLTVTMEQSAIDITSIWGFVGLAIGIFIFRTLSRLLFFYPARVQQKLLRMELLESLEAVPPQRYKNKNQGQIFQILFDDINNLRAFIGFGMLQICNLVIAAWVLIPKFTQTDAYLWPAFSPLFLSVFLFTIVTFVNQKFFKKMMDKKGEVQQYIIESYEAKQTIKNFHREESFINGFVKNSKEELLLFFKSSIGFAFTSPYVKLGLGTSLLWAAVLIRQKGGTTSDLVFFSGFLYLFLEPVMFMSWVAIVVSQGFAAWKRVKELFNDISVQSIEEQKNDLIPCSVTDSDLLVKIPFWADTIELNMCRNQWTILAGETGVGKSYLLSKVATSLSREGVIISMVQQEPYLFNDTIKENIFLGKELNHEMLKRAKDLLVIFQLSSLAPTLDEILDLEVGENGKRLSGGQIKRLALIRSLLSGAEVILWDDPFSSVDIILEKRIISKLKSLKELNHITFILSGHRFTTIRQCDDLIFLDKTTGIRAMGKVKDLLKDKNVTQFFKEQMVDLSLA